jgi:hypothetical protein
MFRTAAVFAAFAFVGYAVLRVVLGVVGGVFGMLLSLAFLAFKIALFVGVAYVILQMVSPATASKVRGAVGLDDTQQP